MCRQLPSWLPQAHLSGSVRRFGAPLQELQTKPQATPCTKSLLEGFPILGMSQETWAISWGMHVLTDGCVHSALIPVFTVDVCTLLCGLSSQRQHSSWELCSLVISVSCSDQRVSWLWGRAENDRKDETKNAITLQWKVMLMQQFPLAVLHSFNLLSLKFYPLYSLEDVRMLVAGFFFK